MAVKNSNKRKTTEQFIADAVAVHGDKYDYSKVEYVRNKDKVKIVCPKHGNFEQIPNHHLQGRGCPECGYIQSGKSCKNFYLNKRDWNFEQPEEYKLIPLTQGKYAKVDNEDFEHLSQFNWHFSNGYVESRELGYIHRYVMNCPSHLEVDHENHNKLDNRKSNLRLATRSQNNYNIRPSTNSSSRYVGVTKKGNKWGGQISMNNNNYYLGLFDDEIECAKARDLKALELRGEFAYLNFPELKEEYLKEINKIK